MTSPYLTIEEATAMLTALARDTYRCLQEPTTAAERKDLTVTFCALLDVWGSLVKHLERRHKAETFAR